MRQVNNEIEVNPEYQDRSIPLYLRKYRFETDYLVNYYTEGARKAGRWWKLNRPADWDAEGEEESRRKAKAWLKDRKVKLKEQLDRLVELEAPRSLIDQAKGAYYTAKGEYGAFVGREAALKSDP